MKKIGYNYPRYFYDRWGDIEEVIQNPCGCCPFSVIYKTSWHHRQRGIYKNGVSLGFKSQRAVNKWINSKKYLTELL